MKKITTTFADAWRRSRSQTIYNHVATHLMGMSSQSVSYAGHPMYRGLGGAACAIGCLIPAIAYEKAMEGRTVSELIRQFPIAAGRLSGISHRMLVDLQLIHDHAPNWGPGGLTRDAMIRLQRVGRNYYLDTEVLRKINDIREAAHDKKRNQKLAAHSAPEKVG